MIPKKLTIEGLYSYQSAQTIDFDDLTAAGLFGIFGKVGSGKSSILEAITVALYGSNDRLGNKVASSYDLMNLKSSRLYISLEFLNYENQLFRIDRRAHRNRNDFHDVIKDPGGLYAWDGTDWKPVVDRKVEDIVGMNFENFRRTIIIPQGKFKEFMELGNTERTKMLREIFSLHRFDLSAQVRQLREANAAALANLQGELNTLDAATPEALAEEKEQFTTRQAQATEVAAAIRQLTQVITNLEKLEEATRRHAQHQQAFQTLEVQQEDFNRIKKETDEYERIHKRFAQPLARRQSLKENLQVQQEKLATADKQLQETQQALTKTEQAAKILQPRLAEVETMTRKARDYDHLAEATVSLLKLKELGGRIANGEKFIKELEVTQLGLEKMRKDTEAQRKTLKAQTLPADVLAGLRSWYDRQSDLEESRKTLTAELAALQSRIQRNLDEITKCGLQPDTAQACLAEQKKQLAGQIGKAEERLRSLEVQAQLAHFAGSLHAGEPCPLCGALEHPSIREADDVSAQVEEARQQLLNLKKKQEEGLTTETQVQRLLASIDTLREQQSVISTKLAQATTDQNSHRKAFQWEGFSAEDGKAFEAAYRQQKDLQQQLDATEQHLEDLQQKYQKDEDKLKQCREGYNKLQVEYGQYEATRDGALSRLEILTLQAAKGQDDASLKEVAAALRKAIEVLQQEEQTLLKKQNDLNQQNAAQQTAFNMLRERVKELTAEQETAQKELAVLLAQEQTDLATVELTLKKDLSVEAQRQKVEAFRQQLERAKSLLEEATAALAGRTFQVEKLRVARENLQQKTEEEQMLLGQLGAARQRMETLEKNLQRKTELTQEVDRMQRRADNLQTLTNLFNAQGFVDFISSEYLRQLVAAANERFHRMTHHQLSLELNERNGFDVVDYLNEGRRRSVKTLSGGQGFQASLSLALALAESVQTQAQATQNFFFIDEGFGTQDPESVNIVFDTLQDLQKGNRMVGIISHLDELKERIPVSLEVRNDPQTGSVIRRF